MRIAHLGVEIVPARNGAYVGGLVKSVATLARMQAAKGSEVEVFTTDLHGALKGSPDNGIASHAIPTGGTYGSVRFAASFMRRGAKAVRRAHTRDPFDVIHVHSAYATFGNVGRLLPGNGLPSVFGLTSPNFRARPGHSCNGGPSPGTGALVRASLRPYDATIVPSAHLRSRLDSLGVPPERTIELPPAVDPTVFDGPPSKDEARATLGLEEDRPVVAFVGNYSPWKGAEDLLVGMREVLKRHPDALLLTAWGEPYEWAGNREADVLRLIASLGLGPVVRQVGIVPDIRAVYRAADVLASPFLCTCKVLDLPLSLLEAAALGCPIVATDVGGIPEILGREGDRGILVEPRDPRSLGRAIASLLDDPRRRSEVGARAARWARERFRPDAIVARAGEIYAWIQDGKGDRPAPTASPAE